MFFFFKQKTAYEMRISDWSSDVCSSDLGPRARHPRKRQPKYPNADCPRRPHLNAQEPSFSGDSPAPAAPPPRPRASISLVVLATLAIGYKIGRASCRQRVGQDV